MEDKREYTEREKKIGVLLWRGYLLLLLGFLFWKGYGFAAEKIEEKERVAAAVYSVEYTIEGNLEVLQGFLPEKWAELTEVEKWEVLQTAANTEANYLGIRKPLPVTILDLEEGVNGRYVLGDHEIQIDGAYVADGLPEEILATLCHETYHAYQTAAVEAFAQTDAEKQALLLFRKAEIYQKELQEYKKGLEDFAGYYAQELERDAREYSRSAVKDWYEKLGCRTAGF